MTTDRVTRHLFSLLALLEREGAISIPQAAQLLGISEEEARHETEILVFCFDPLDIRIDLQHNYARLEDDGRRRLLRLTEHEASVLVDALRMAGIAEDDPLCVKLLGAKGPVGSEEIERRMRLVSSIDVGPGMQYLIEACEQHLLVEIDYHKDGSSTGEERIVEPERLAFEEGHWFLEAYCRIAQGQRSFRVDRIRDTRLLDEGFVPHIDGASGTQHPQATIVFAAGADIERWPDLEVIEEHEDGSFIAKTPWLGSRWLPKKLVSMLGKATVLDPPELIDATREYAELLLAECIR